MVTEPSCEVFGTAQPRSQMCGRSVAVLTCMLAITGCSIDDHGLVKVTYTETEISRIRHVIAAGLHVETHGPLAGLSVGHFRALEVQIKSCGRFEPRLHYQNIAGLSVTTSRYEIGLTVGQRETLLAAPGEPNGASAVRIDPDHPETAEVYVSRTPRTNCQTQFPRHT